MITKAAFLLILLPALAWGQTADTLRPSAFGSVNHWTGVITSIDEDSPNDISDFIYTTTTSEWDSVQIQLANPTLGTIDSVRVKVRATYDDNPARMMEIAYDTGAGFVAYDTLDMSGTVWQTSDVLKFTSPDSIHIASLQIQLTCIEEVKSGAWMMCTWVQPVGYYTTPSEGKSTIMRVIIGD